MLDSLTSSRATIISLQEELRDLQAKLGLRAVMEFREPAYWQKREGQPDDGPFWPQCWESVEKRCRLHPAGDDGRFVCKTCRNVIGEGQRTEHRKATSSLSDFFSAGT